MSKINVNHPAIIATEIPIYRQKLTLISATEIEQVEHFFKGSGFDFSEGLYAHTLKWKREVDGKDMDCIYVIFNPENEYRKLTPGVIAHEALHVVEYTFAHRDIEIDLSNSEPANYLLEWVVDLLYEHIVIL